MQYVLKSYKSSSLCSWNLRHKPLNEVHMRKTEFFASSFERVEPLAVYKQSFPTFSFELKNQCLSQEEIYAEYYFLRTKTWIKDGKYSGEKRKSTIFKIKKKQ